MSGSARGRCTDATAVLIGEGRGWLSEIREARDRPEEMGPAWPAASAGGGPEAVSKSVATLSTSLLRQLDGRIERTLEQGRAGLDPYSAAHLEDARSRIRRSLEAVYVYK